MKSRNMKLRGTALVAALVALSTSASMAGITRGPWLLSPTTAGVTVCWTTSGDTQGVVRVIPDVTASRPGAGNRPLEFRESRRGRLHRVRVSGLRPYTRYRYQVVCDGATRDGSFTTAAAPGQGFRFVAYGDNRSGPAAHAKVIARILAFRPDFVLQTGDLVANGANLAQWDELFGTAAPMFRAYPLFTVQGNHEGGAAPYFRYMGYTRDYSFNYGDCHIVALDTNRPPSELGAQAEWLRRDLAAHQSARWRIVFCHHTFHTVSTGMGRRRESAERLRRFGPLLKAGRVQLVISGHDHNYQRHLQNGITYVVTGGGGAPLYEIGAPTPYLKAAVKAHHECEFTVLGTAMFCRVVATDGGVIDTFRIPASR